MAEKEKLLQWHTAFYAGIQIELEEEAKYLVFENEHMLSTKPMQIDVLIIKKNTERSIKKNIGRIFRKYNIVEYKSPEDYLSIDDFYKVLGYACFYKSDGKTVNEIKAEELTVSFVCSHYPREVIKHLRKIQGLFVEKQEAGIYYVKGERFPIQLLVTTELSEDNNLWLRSLTNDLQETESVEKLVRAYGKNQKNDLYTSVMDIVVRANVKKFDEVRKMCDALKELMKEELEEKKQEGITQGIPLGNQAKLEELVGKKIRKGKPLEQIAEDLEEEPETIRPIYERLIEELQ